MVKSLMVAMLAGLSMAASPTDPGQGGTKWRAILEPAGGGKVRGGAMVEAKADGSTRFTITIRDASPNATLAWHMHSGTCASPGGVVGSGYPELHSGPGGTAEAAVTLQVPAPSSGDFVVQVHDPSGAPISCGELKRIGAP